MSRAVLLASLMLLLAPSAARADLDEYLAKPEPKFKWEKKGEETVKGCTVHELHLVSQEWQGFTWEHKLVVIRPEKLEHPGFCALYNTGGRGGKGDVELGAELAAKSGATFVMLFGIPMQPLWNKTEDALVVHTWVKFIETYLADGKGDESWPLHFPMAKAVLKAMDAVQAYAKESKWEALDRFMVCGASKRGWTSWLVGASKDPRVVGIAPMVIDTLNIERQAELQVISFGKPSEQIKDYVGANLGEILKTPAGKRLLELEDPYSYRDRLTMPKLIINGTNDRYWPQDALNAYWDGLQGPKWVLYVPNSGHRLEDRGRLGATLVAYVRTLAKGVAFPTPHWKYVEQGTGVRLTVEADVPIVEARLFSAEAKTLDLRDSKWSYALMSQGEKGSWSAGAAPPAEGVRAVFGEVVFETEGARFTLSTQIKILKAIPAIAQPETPKGTKKYY